MTIQWANNFDALGNALGYSTHQKNLRAALERAGVVMDDNSDIAVSIITPESYTPIEGKYNVLYTMYECTSIPKHWIEPLQGADLIIVPCTHNKKLFRQYTDKPIEVCWEGVDIDKFTYKKRPFPKDGEPFVFLWVGASNPRKGYEHVIFAWADFKKKHPDWNTVLYMKTTQVTREERFEQESGNVFIDTRYLPLEKEAGDKLPTLVDLYHMAHAFLLPSMGEGFGLTLAEAMSTGLPCIYTPWSGPQDFCSWEEGYPVKYKFVTVRTKEDVPEALNPRIIHESTAASAIPQSIVKQMERIYEGYERAQDKGKKAAERIREDITWDKSAASFIKIIEQYTKERL